MEILGFFCTFEVNLEHKQITMDKAQAMIDEHYAHMNSNRSSYEIVPPNLEECKRIAEYNKARRPELYK